MSRETEHKAEPIAGREGLLDYFRRGSKPRATRALGIEHEKFGFEMRDGELVPVGYPTIERVLLQLSERFGWDPEFEGENVIALARGSAAVTLEPGGQLELAGSVFRTLDAAAVELKAHLDEVLDVSDPLGVRWLTIGAQPFHGLDAIAWMPKARYRIMRAYLPTRGALALNMMKTTSTVQMNYDYVDEDDAAEILRAVMHATPIASALFATSPFALGALSGFASTRCHYWTDTDPDRCGYLPKMLEPGFTFGDYLDYLLDMPMFFIRREGTYVDATGRTFRQFLADGLGEHQASMGDFEVHVSTAFPEVRLKQYIEVRGTDCGPPEMMMAAAALWKGILYDEDARRSAIALTEGLDLPSRLALHQRMITDGLAARTDDGTPFSELAGELVGIAVRGLEAQATHDNGDEVRYLEPLARLLLDGRSAAERMRDVYVAAGAGPAALETALDGFWLTRETLAPIVVEEQLSLDVLYLDEALLAVNKPAGVPSHAGVQHRHDHLMAHVEAFLVSEGIAYEKPLAPANRLDMEASGIVLVALTASARTALGGLFERHEVKKTYWVLVAGALRAKGVINKPLRRGKQESKPARTQYRTIATSKRASLAKATAETGRTHQVRRHMAAIGHPLLGDTRYGFRRAAVAFRRRIGMERVMLHARQVSLPHPLSGEPLHLVSTPDATWFEALAFLGLQPQPNGNPSGRRAGGATAP